MLSWGVLQKHGVQNKCEFWTLLRHAKKGTTSRVFYHNLLYWISLMLGQGGAKLAKNMQEHVFIDVPRPGNTKKSEKFPRIFSRSKKVLPAVPALFFLHKKCLCIFHCVARGIFERCFHDFFRTFCRSICRTVFSQNFSHVPLCIFLTHLFRAVSCPKGFIVCSLSTA